LRNIPFSLSVDVLGHESLALLSLYHSPNRHPHSPTLPLLTVNTPPVPERGYFNDERRYTFAVVERRANYDRRCLGSEALRSNCGPGQSRGGLDGKMSTCTSGKKAPGGVGDGSIVSAPPREEKYARKLWKVTAAAPRVPDEEKGLTLWRGATQMVSYQLPDTPRR
jgi:hypothetical protein